MKKTSKVAKSIIIIYLFLLGAIPQSTTNASVNQSENAAPDLTQWVPSLWGGAKITRNNGLTITTNSSYDMSGVEVYTAYQFTGDFDVQVDYKAGTGWEGPYESYRNDPHLIAASMGIDMDGSKWSIVRYIDSRWSSKFHNIGMYSITQGWNDLRWEQTSPSYSGKYRIIRTGSDVEFQYYKDSYWFGYYSLSGIDKPVSIYLSASSVWTNHTFSTVFENFMINSGKTNYVPLVWEDTFPDRPSFMVGAQAHDYLIERTWGNTWRNNDPWQTLKENGGEWARVLVTTSHSQELSETAVEEWSTLPFKDEYWGCREYAEEVMREAQDVGLRLDLVMPLADIGWNLKQDAPAEWKGLSIIDTAAALKNYTYSTAKYYQTRGLNIELYEIGNEIQWGILDFIPGGRIPTQEGVDPLLDVDYLRNNVWNIEAQLLKSGISGVRQADPDAKIILHVAGLGYSKETENVELGFFKAMIENGVDFDYAGITHVYPQPDSYDPSALQWDLPKYANHTWFQHMQTVIGSIAGLGKKVLISEAAYPSSKEGFYCNPMPDYPFTPKGQADWLHDQLLFASNNPAVEGWFYFGFESFPGFYSSQNMVWANSLGLFVNDAQPQPAMREYLMGRKPATFEYSDLTVSPIQVRLDEDATISVNVRNTGDIVGTATVGLKISGVTEESRKVTVGNGTQTTVSFTISKPTAGSYTVQVGSLNGILTVSTPLRPASISVKSLRVSKALVKSGEEVTVNATLENTGELSGSYTFVYSLDGVQKDSSTVTLDGGETIIKTIKFATGVEGTHLVSAGGQSVSFEVQREQAQPPSGIPGYMLESVIVGLALSCMVLFLTRVSRRYLEIT